MLSAERKLLLTNSAPEAMTTVQQSSASPSMQAGKRRHTAVFGGSEPVVSPEKTSKRTKTLKTYGGRAQTEVTDDGTFERLRDDAPDPKTSQSARFTEHSGIDSFAELPAGSIQAEFINHEPAMFRDSGSTIADNSSAHQRLLEQALGPKRALNTSTVHALGSDEQKSSSFPWSASEQTRSAKSTGKPADTADERTRADDANIVGVDDSNAPAASDNNPSIHKKQSAQPKFNEDSHDVLEKPSARVSPAVSLDPPLKPQPSPSVEIPAASTKAPTSTQRSTRGRKRKSEETNTTDPLNSDDKAIGLPKERYQPRPSRRRATAVVEEPIDFSVRPEKAAKAKRTKTTNAATSFNADNFNPDSETTKSPDVAVRDRKPVMKRSGDNLVPDDQMPACETEKRRSEEIGKSFGSNKSQKAQDLSSQHADSMPPPTEQKSDDHTFVKPAMPTPKPKSSSKTKRSHTTIYEDHIDFSSSQRSPSLRQKQAKRNSALEYVQNEATEPSQRKRRTVVVDEEDDEEDELAKDSDDDLPNGDNTAPKKRGKGRPQKAKTKPKAKSAEKVWEDPDDNDDDPVEEEEAPKKRGRGRPPKAAAPSQAEPTVDDIANISTTAPQPVSSIERPSVASAEITNKSDHDESEVLKTSCSAKDRPTPSPSPTKSDEKAAATPQKAAKPSPAQHSPIKAISGSSMARYRVGYVSYGHKPSPHCSQRCRHPSTYTVSDIALHV